MFGEAELLVSMGYGWDVIGKLPADAIVGYHLHISGNPSIIIPSANSISELFAKLSPAITAGLKGQGQAAPLGYKVLPPDFVKTSFTVSEQTLTPTEMIEFIRTGALPTAEPEPPPEPPPPEELPAYFTIDSEPAGGEIWIDDVYTGYLTWKPNIEVSPGYHKVEIKGLAGYADTQVRRLAVAGETRTFSIPMAPLPVPTPPEEELPPKEIIAELEPIPEPPPPEPEPEVKPDWRTIFEAAIQPFLPGVIFSTLLDMTMTAWEDLVNAGLDALGLPRTGTIAGYEIPKAPLIMFLATIAIPDGTDVALGAGAADDIMKWGAAQIRAEGTVNPKGLASLIKALPKEQVAALFGRLQGVTGGKAAIETIQRVIFDQRLVLSKWKVLAGATGGGLLLYQLAHTLNYMGFLAEETIQTIGIGIFALISNKLWKDAAAELPKYKQSVDMIVTGIDALAAVPVLSFWLNLWWPNYKAGAYSQIASYETVIAAGLEAEAVETTISVTTNEDPALASIPDVFLQKVTPFTANIAAGSYDLRVEKEGYVEKVLRIIVSEKQDNPVVVQLQPISPEIVPKAGRLEVAAYDFNTKVPLLASFYINDRLEKATAHAIVLDLVPGVYEVRVEAMAYNIFQDTVVVDENTTTKVNAMLQKPVIIPPEPPPEEPPPEPTPPEAIETGRLEVNANVPASILLGGVDTGKKTPAAFELTQGIYSVGLQAEGYVSRSTTTLVKIGEPTAVFLELQEEAAPPPKARVARVSIRSEPVAAKISVNGVFAKKYTPDNVLLEAGDYEISLAKTGYYVWSTPLRLVEE